MGPQDVWAPSSDGSSALIGPGQGLALGMDKPLEGIGLRNGWASWALGIDGPTGIGPRHGPSGWMYPYGLLGWMGIGSRNGWPQWAFGMDVLSAGMGPGPKLALEGPLDG